MWEAGQQKRVVRKNVLDEAKLIDGTISDAESRVLLAKLLRDNLGFAWQLMSGQEMFLPFQEILVNAWFRKDYSLVVAGRGVGKSYLLAVFICLYCIFHPNTKIVLVANNFRRVKDIFSQIEKFLNYKDAQLLRQCFEMKTASTIKMGKQNDQYLLNCLNGSVVKGLPLGVGENLRGERANVLIIDEGLLISEHVQDTILRPFLTAKSNAGAKLKIKLLEDELIKAGELKEDERTVFPNNKLIITSSASYQFDYLYQGIYVPYLNNILSERKERAEKDPSYFVARMSYKAVPEGSFLDESVLKAAKETRPDNPVFRREYEAMFVDDSEGYFNVKKLHECTLKDGEYPTVQVRGSKAAKYMLAIDPAYGASKANDFFAMGVYMLLDDKRIIQVHSYGQAGADIKEHYQYLIYLLKSFNIVYTVIDGSGTEFIDGFNNSVLAEQAGIKLGYIKADFELEGEDYVREIQSAKEQWNLTNRTIVYPQKFSSSTLRRMNEYLQGGIAASSVWFGSKIEKNPPVYKATVSEFKLPFNMKDIEGEEYTVAQFLSDQDDWIEQTKRQLALIEVKSTQLGTLQYDIPAHMKKSKNEKRPRRDNYTCLLMAYYASKHYYDMVFAADDIAPVSFTPMFF